jgi:hypothetical protein
MDDQGCPEAQKLYDSPEQISLTTWRTGDTLLQIAQAPHQVPVDRESKAGAARPKYHLQSPLS